MSAGVQRVSQPQPHRSPGGDCYACALQATLAHLCPERTAPTFDDTDRWFVGRWAEPTGTMRDIIRRVAGGDVGDQAVAEARELQATLDRYEREPPTCNDWTGMDKALWNARSEGWPIEWQIEQAVHPNIDVGQWGPGWVFQDDPRGYARRLDAWLAAGWVCITNVLFSGTGPFTDDLLMRSPDHFVVLDGVREAEGDQHWNRPEIHVVCSARGDYWIDAMKWQRGHGGLSWLLVRRRPQSRVRFA